MKRLFVLVTIVLASLIASSAYSQVYVNAHVGLRLPRIHGLPIPVPVPVIYRSAPVYQPAPVYQDAYPPAPAPVIYDQAYPETAYYTYPAWNGHYRDHAYYEHYRPYYERDHGAYARYDRGHSRYEDHGRSDHRGRY
jgi:hypothetical protein